MTMNIMRHGIRMKAVLYVKVREYAPDVMGAEPQYVKNAIPAMKPAQNVGAKDMPAAMRMVRRFATNAAATVIYRMATVAEPESSLVRDVVDQENAKPAAEQESRMLDMAIEVEIR